MTTKEGDNRDWERADIFKDPLVHCDFRSESIWGGTNSIGALGNGRLTVGISPWGELIYFRFADHISLIPENIKVKIFKVHPEEGFEPFINEILTIIEKFGKGAAYVFDSLNDLAVDWYSDKMVANFFMLTCPYLFDFETETYFAIIRNKYSEYTITKIHNTAQIIIDVYNKE